MISLFPWVINQHMTRPSPLLKILLSCNQSVGQIAFWFGDSIGEESNSKLSQVVSHMTDDSSILLALVWRLSTFSYMCFS